MNLRNVVVSIITSIIVAVLLGIGGTVASHGLEIAGIKEKLNAVHEDVREIKKILLEKAL